MKIVRSARLLVSVLSIALLLAPRSGLAGEAKIYVIREADGALRFTNKPPADGQEAQIFTSTGNGGSFVRARTALNTEILGTRSLRTHTLRTSTLREYPRERFFIGGRASLRLPQGSIRMPQGQRVNLFPDLYADEIDRASSDHEVDPALVRAVIHAESAFNPYAVSPKGARGLMQLMPATARMLGVKNSFSPESNIRGGTKYLAQLLRRFRNEAHAIAAYNAGEVPVNRHKGVPPYSETREYVRRVLSLKKQYTLQSNG
jgi:soluble lytic murein transglycosylase-like protein